jgi:hypothetical protein
MQSTGEEQIGFRSDRATTLIGQARLATGLLQGLIAWLLLKQVASTYIAPGAQDLGAPYWSSLHPMSFAALALVTAYVPVIAIAEMGRMRRATLAIYIGLAGAIVAALAAYDLWRDPIELWGAGAKVRVWPSFTLSLCATLGLFIVNQLLEHRERGNKLFTQYANHFEDSWMRGFQLIVSVIFALLVWGLLELGAELFHLIHLDWFRTMIGHNWFRCPALAVSFAAAIHITDVRPALLKGVRNVGLTLLSWLLPIVVILGAGFLGGLAFVGVKPLWATGHAASILLWACAITVILLNAAYKDGDPSNLPPAALRWTARVAGPIVLALSMLAAYAIGLRVYQHGWTPERVFSTAAAFMALVYGAGYTYASASQESWLRPLEGVNVAASLAILAILALLLSPIADPARLSVNSQVWRLSANKLSSSEFDYEFLRFDSGRFGSQALAQLATGTNEDVRTRAVRMQRTETRSFRFRSPDRANSAVTEPAFSHATVYPKDATLPQDFRDADFSRTIPTYGFSCLRDGTPCDIYVLPSGAAGETTIVVRFTNDSSHTPSAYVPPMANVFQRDRDGKWVDTGTLSGAGCPEIVDALREGTVTWVRPEHDDLVVHGVRLRISPVWRADGACAKPPIGEQEKARDADAPAHMGPAFGKP